MDFNGNQMVQGPKGPSRPVWLSFCCGTSLFFFFHCPYNGGSNNSTRFKS